MIWSRVIEEANDVGVGGIVGRGAMSYLAQPPARPSRALYLMCAPAERVVELKRRSQRVRG